MIPMVYHDNYSCPFPADHRFVMSKFVDLYQHLRSRDLIKNNLFQPISASVDDLSIAHSKAYLLGLRDNQLTEKEWRRIGLPYSPALIERTFTAPNGTLLAARLALDYGMACHLAGGTHHAHYDFGSGFCMVNDLAYTALSLLNSGDIERVLIFDLDVHQGDGTASILASEPRAFTCSIHGEKNFPFRKSQSDLDIGLPDGIEDKAYLHLVQETLHQLIDTHRPDLVLYDAGVDIWEKDSLGRFDISWDGLYKRDEMVLSSCIRRHIPVATVIGGGYDRNHNHLAVRHSIVVEVASALYNRCF